MLKCCELQRGNRGNISLQSYFVLFQKVTDIFIPFTSYIMDIYIFWLSRSLKIPAPQQKFRHFAKLATPKT